MKHHNKAPRPNSANFPAEDAEAAVCAYMLYNPEAFISQAIAARITEEKFSNEIWKTLFAIIMEFHKAGRAQELCADCGLVFLAEMRRRGMDKHFGDNCHLVAQLWAKYYTYGAAFELWAYQVNDTFARKHAAEMVGESLADIGDPSVANPDVQSALISTARYIDINVDSEAETADPKEVFKALAVEVELRQAGEGQAIPTGISSVDSVTGGGMALKQLWVVGAKTGGGKSVLLLQIAGGAMRYGAKVLIFSLEMSKTEVLKRILAGTYGADYEAISRTSGEYTRGELESLQGALKAMKADNPDVHTNDRGAVSTEYIQAEIERLRPQVVIVDYLQLLQMDGERGTGREERIVAAVNELKAIAKNSNCCVITASQLNDEGKLYAARGIAFASDAVFVVETDGSGVKVAKLRSRQRPEGSIPLVMNGAKQRFVNTGDYNDRETSERR